LLLAFGNAGVLVRDAALVAAFFLVFGLGFGAGIGGLSG